MDLQFDCQRANFQNHTPGGLYSIWAKTFEPAGGGVTQNVSVVPGSMYNFSSQVWFETVFSQTGAQIQLGLTWMDASNNPVGTANTFNIDSSSNPPVNSWQSYGFGGVAPVGATQVQVSLGWSGGSTVTGQQNVFFDDADLEGNGTPPTNSIWITNGSGDFNISGNWANGVVPNGVGAEADFFSAIAAPHTVFTDVAITAGTLNFNNANTYVLTGAGTLTLQTSTGNAQVIVQQGTQKINLPTIIASNTTFNVSGGATLIIANPLTINSGKTVTQTGAGSVNYQSIVNVLGGAGIVFGNSTHAHQLNISAAGTASIGGTGSVLNVDSLSNGGIVDVQKNSMLISYGTGTDPASTVQAQLTTGYHNGAWNGTGINTSMSIANKTAVGWKDDTSGKAITVKYVRYGDTNLDGVVNTSDFTAMAGDFNKTSQVWSGGDFNYDGKVNALDFNALATNFGQPLTEAALGSVVPEPISGSMLLLASMIGAGWRRRRIG